MSTKQPIWKLIAQLGDAQPITYGGYWIYEDTTGVYDPEGELLISPEEWEKPQRWTIYRFSLERCTLTPHPETGENILSDNKFHPLLSAWFAKEESMKKDRPQDTTYLSRAGASVGSTVEELQAMFCSEDIVTRAMAYQMVGGYHGFGNLDPDPLVFTEEKGREGSGREEVETRYQNEKIGEISK